MSTINSARKPKVPVNIQNMAPKPRLTHFLCIPLGHHVALRDKWTHISSQLLAVSPPIQGLHPSIIIPPRSLHLTLGVMSLSSDNGTPSEQDVLSRPRRHTISDALGLLQSLREPISALLREDASTLLEVPLNRLDVMETNPARAHILWSGPDVQAGAGVRLLRVCELVHESFLRAGMLQDTRPLKLHCTLVNTVYRRPRGKRIQFSCTALRSSAAYVLMGGQEGQERPWHVDLGTWPVNEVQLCEMGRTADGAYRSVGSIVLNDESVAKS